MKSILQLFRQPLKNLGGLAILALAVSILCVCLGQSMAAAQTQTALEDNYITVALPTAKYQKGTDFYGRETVSKTFPESVLDWIRDTAQANPDIVKAVDARSLASAYIPELQPDSPLSSLTTLRYRDDTGHGLAPAPFNAPYSQAMLRVQLQETGPVTRREDGTVAVSLSGTVTEVFSLAPSYADPALYRAELLLILPDEASLDRLALTEGREYLVYGRDYQDLDWRLRCEIWEETRDKFHVGLELSYIDLAQVYAHSEKNIETFRRQSTTGDYPVAYLLYDRPGADRQITEAYQLTNADMEKLHTVTLTLDGTSALPSIAPITQSPEDFFAQNPLWESTRADMAVSFRSFPVVGTEALMSVAAFAQENARITAGRDFTDQEIAAGADVCILSSQLAAQNGLQVGDTVTLHYYRNPSPSQPRVSDGEGIIHPTAAYFDSSASFSGEEKTYTVVGLYEQDLLWQLPSENLYAFTHNTLFVPAKAVVGSADYANQGFFLSLILENGQLAAFQSLVEEANHSGLFEYYDQGYSEVKQGLHDYAGVSGNAALIGCCLYALIFLCYLLCFPLRQRPDLEIMRSLGAPRREAVGHVLQSALGLLLPGTVLGILISLLLWDRITCSLTASAHTNLILRLAEADIPAIAAAQLLLSLAVILCAAVWMTREPGPVSRSLPWLFRFRTLCRRQFKPHIIFLLSAVSALILCAMDAAVQEEQAHYEASYQSAPVTVQVVDFANPEKQDLPISGSVLEMFTNDRLQGISIAKYLTDLQIKASVSPTFINGQPADRLLAGITSLEIEPELTDMYSARITWNDGYGPDIFTSSQNVCIAPSGYSSDGDPETAGQQVLLDFGIWQSDEILFSDTYTVVGFYETLAQTQDFYAPYQSVQQTGANWGSGQGCDRLQGTVADNRLLPELREKAQRLFVAPGATEFPPNKVPYALDINDDALLQLQSTLESSIRINRVCTLLVFALTAGAGFFLGFLMVRGRKREILLMRTLGKPNGHIYLDFVREQMVWLLVGTALGGAPFLWDPPIRLLLFALIYFAGLSGALRLFLRSTLITTLKEAE